MREEVTKIKNNVQEISTKTFASKMGALTGSIITCCINVLIIAITARIVLWII